MARDHSKPVKPAAQRMLRASVIARERVTPGMNRITIAGGQLGEFVPMGFDQWFRLFIPRDGQQAFRLPQRGDMLGYAQYLATPKSVQPIMRNYSVRAYRAIGASGGPELDIDVVAHAGGAVADWAERVEAGTEVAILDEGIGFAPPDGTEWVLLVADETGLPAVAGICASLSPEARGLAIVEVPSADDRQEFASPAGVEVRWVVRDADRPAGTVALATLLAAEPPRATPYAFTVGEAAMVTGVRRHLVNDRGVPKSAIAFCGYWRLPRPEA